MSPLLPYVNAYLLITTEGNISITNGRVVSGSGSKYLVGCYLVRQQATGTTTGADYIPTQTNPGDVLPGVSGYVYLYSGYALRYRGVEGDYELGDEVPGNGWVELGITKPQWLADQVVCKHLQGDEQVKHCVIERISGKYGNKGIDEIINKEIGGVPIVVRSGDVMK